MTVEGVNINDKIVTFTLQQYISAFKAYWQTVEFKAVKIKPSIMVLQVSLENKQMVIYKPDNNNATNGMNKKQITQLMAYFEANTCSVSDCMHIARNLYYEDIPSYFVWTKGHYFWALSARQPSALMKQMQLGKWLQYIQIQEIMITYVSLCLFLKHKKGHIV